MDFSVLHPLTYLGEIRASWRALLAASFGQAAGYSLINYVGNVFTPHLLQEFGWSRSVVALAGTTIFLNILVQPLAGRLADILGVRRMAAIGIVSMPLVFLGFSAMTGTVAQFYLLTLVMVTVVGGTTSATVYSRLIARSFSRARGFALAVAACAPALAGAACVPFLSRYIDASGWRQGYIALAVAVGIAGLLVQLAIPSHSDVRAPAKGGARGPAGIYGAIGKDRTFLLIASGIVLCSLSITMQTTQLKVILLDRAVESNTGSLAISLFAVSVIVGRLLCGVALDRFPPYAVVAVSLGLPGIGLALLASGASALVLIVMAVVLLGLGLGAEGDVMAYLVMRYFKPEIYSTVLGMIFGALALSMAAGALVLSYLLELTQSYTPFLALCAVAALVGSALFLRLRTVSTVQ
jgi:MFS family permease